MPPKSAINLVRALQSQNEDFDGVPMEDEEIVEQLVASVPDNNINELSNSVVETSTAPKGGFIPSKVTCHLAAMLKLLNLNLTRVILLF